MAHRERTCIGCRKVSDKRDYLRIARSRQGGVSLDLSGKAPGRGAYVCSLKCFENAVRSKRLASSLRANLTQDLCASLATDLAVAFSNRQSGTANAPDGESMAQTR